MKNYNYELKSKILKSNEYLTFVKYKNLSNKYYLSLQPFSKIEPLNDYDIKHMQEYFIYMEKFEPSLLREYNNLYSSHIKRVSKLKKRITSILNKGSCIFLTLTFTDESLSKTSDFTRRKYVTYFLKQVSTDYVANIDFGKNNGREHYHAVILAEHIDYHLWLYGAINGIKIRNQTTDIKKISKYIAKLTNHAIKETTKRNHIIYSR